MGKTYAIGFARRTLCYAYRKNTCANSNFLLHECVIPTASVGSQHLVCKMPITYIGNPQNKGFPRINLTHCFVLLPFLFAIISNLPHRSVVAKKFSIQATRVQIPGVALFLNNIRLYGHFLDSFGFIPRFRQKHLNLWVICLYKCAQVFFQHRL